MSRELISKMPHLKPKLCRHSWTLPGPGQAGVLQAKMFLLLKIFNLHWQWLLQVTGVAAVLHAVENNECRLDTSAWHHHNPHLATGS